MTKRILLADDSITIQKVVRITLADGDYELITVDNGNDAIAKIRELKPDLILSDVVMPGKDGYEVCEEVKKDPALKDIPVILLAGSFEGFDEIRGAQIGADGYIIKPFESQHLISKVEELLARPRKEAEPEYAPPAEEEALGTGIEGEGGAELLFDKETFEEKPEIAPEMSKKEPIEPIEPELSQEPLAEMIAEPKEEQVLEAEVLDEAELWGEDVMEAEPITEEEVWEGIPVQEPYLETEEVLEAEPVQEGELWGEEVSEPQPVEEAVFPAQEEPYIREIQAQPEEGYLAEEAPTATVEAGLEAVQEPELMAQSGEVYVQQEAGIGGEPEIRPSEQEAQPELVESYVASEPFREAEVQPEQFAPFEPSEPAPAFEPSFPKEAEISERVQAEVGKAVEEVEGVIRAGLSREEILNVIRDVVEQVVWEVVPELAEVLIKERLSRLEAEKG